VSIEERPRSCARPTHRRHYNSLPSTSLEDALGILLQPEPRPSGVRIRAGEGSLVLNKGLGSKTSPLRGRMVGSVALDRGEAHLKKVRAALTLGIPSSTAETSLYLSSSE
jgi:hypothetical protein